MVLPIVVIEADAALQFTDFAKNAPHETEVDLRNGLDLRLAVAQHRNERQPPHQLRQRVDRLVVRTVDERGPEHRPGQAALAHILFGGPFRLVIPAAGVLARAERAHVHVALHL